MYSLNRKIVGRRLTQILSAIFVLAACGSVGCEYSYPVERVVEGQIVRPNMGTDVGDGATVPETIDGTVTPATPDVVPDSPEGPPPAVTVCGNGTCEAGETTTSCASDCPVVPPPPPGGSGPPCTAETDAAFCTRLTKNCGSVIANDNCGASRTVASCGTCSSGQTCGAVTANVCGNPPFEAFFNGRNTAIIASTSETPPSGQPPVPTSFAVDDLKLRIKVAPFGDSGTDNNLLFDLCPTEEITNYRCFRATILTQEDNQARLRTGDFREINLQRAAYVRSRDGKPISELHYPQDFQNFRFSLNDDDHLLLAGVELLALPRGRNAFDPAQWISVYRNPYVNRWIGHFNNLNIVSWHSLNDDAYGFTIRTGQGGVGTDDLVSVKIPATPTGNFNRGERDAQYPQCNSTFEEPCLDYSDPNEFGIQLRWPDYDDFGDDDNGGIETSYGVTLYQGHSGSTQALQDKYRIVIGGHDSWYFEHIYAYHIRPGDRAFLDRGSCMFSEGWPGWNMSTDPTEGHGYSTTGSWPRLLDDVDGYQDLVTTQCWDFATVDWDPTYFSFGRR